MRIIRTSQSNPAGRVHKEVENERFNMFFETSIRNHQIRWQKRAWRELFVSLHGDVNHPLHNINYLGFIKREGIMDPSVYTYRLVIDIVEDDMVAIALYINIHQSPTGDNEEIVTRWRVTPDEPGQLGPYIKGEGLRGLMMEEFAINNFEYPSEKPVVQDDRSWTKINMLGKEVEHGIRLTRISDSYGPASALYIYIVKVRGDAYAVLYTSINLETETTGKERIIAQIKENGALIRWADAIEIFNKNVLLAKNNKDYVDETSPLYIPEWANHENWDFILNRPKDVLSVPKDTSSQETNGFDDDDLSGSGFQYMSDILGKSNKKILLSQDFGGYFTGNIPEYGAGMLGTGAVEASQIKSFFNKADYAIQLVNNFDSSLLSNISFIFNFSKSGAYGVYLSELDRAIKTSALKKKLENQGYKVEANDQGFLTAYPVNEEKSSDEIQADIDNLYSQIESQGGTAFGINMGSILSAAKQDAMAVNSPDSEIWQWMAALHLGGTIVHEAVHAKGSHDEGPSESAESNFIQWALPQINQDYQQELESQGKGDLFAPIIVGAGTRHASVNGWYRRAQNMSYIPNIVFGKPNGSDLEGRFVGNIRPDTGMASWDKLMQMDQSTPIEKRLSREFMSPLPPDLNQNHDSIEEQLRKYTRDGQKLDTTSTTEALLYDSHDDDASYKLTEELLDEQRPKPLLIPISKKASIIKEATLFGWYNNLDLADGSTIPGLSDRVMLWEDADEDFRTEEQWIKKQPRYNPTYDVKGFYYRWIEPRFKPQLFDDMTRDLDNTHPAKRFASRQNLPPDITKVISVLSQVKRELNEKTMPSMRFVMSADLLPLVAKIFSSAKIGIRVFDLPEDLIAVWVFTDSVKDQDIDNAEQYLGGRMECGFSDNMEKLLDKLMGVSARYEETTHSVLDAAKQICKMCGINEMYVIGSYARTKAISHDKMDLPTEMEFSSELPSNTMKIGWAIAEKLGVDLALVRHTKYGVSFPYRGMVIRFAGNIHPLGMMNKMEEYELEINPFTMDVYNKDFTINMMAYDIVSEKLLDISGKSKSDIQNRYIRTYFNSSYICRQNPMVMLRAVLLRMQHSSFRINPELEEAIIKNSHYLFDGKITRKKLIIAREKILSFGKKKAEDILNSLALGQLLNL